MGGGGGGESSVGVSVSFGKYENELCWEKWSTFSPNPNNNNRYLEEVGKCSTPGSVAQKKAFFEAHYKKLAAIKAAAAAAEAEADLLLLDQPQHHSRSDIQQQDSTPHGSAQHQDDDCMLQSPISANNALEAAVLVNVESMNLVKQHFHVDLDPPNKITPNKVEKKNSKKTPASASVVVPRLPKSKPKATSAPPSLKKNPSTPSSSSSSKINNLSASESRRFTPSSSSSSSWNKAPVSLHLSMSMNSDTPSSVTPSTRRSLFMEQMGDKDIVKRAFKTFQNRVNQLPSSDTGAKQLPTKRSEQKTWTPMAYQKENERSRKAAAAEKINPARGQLGPTRKSVSSGSLKGVVVDERRLKAGPTPVVLRSNERSERRKEFFKNLEEKSNARVAERSQLSIKPKEVKDAEMKKVRQKAKAQGALKST